MTAFIDPSLLDDLCNCTVTIVRDGVATPNGRGAMTPGEPVAVLTDAPAQEWPLDAKFFGTAAG